MKIKTADLKGDALDYAVGIAHWGPDGPPLGNLQPDGIKAVISSRLRSCLLSGRPYGNNGSFRTQNMPRSNSSAQPR